MQKCPRGNLQVRLMQFHCTAPVNYLLIRNQADALFPALAVFRNIMCDLKAPFCCVPQWMGKTWANAGTRREGGPRQHHHLGYAAAMSHEESAHLPILSRGFTSWVKRAVPREQKHFTQGFFFGMTRPPQPR